MEAYLDIAGWIVAGLFVVFCIMMLWQYIVVKMFRWQMHQLSWGLMREVQHRAFSFGGEPFWLIGITLAATVGCIFVANLPVSENILIQGKALALVGSVVFLVVGPFRVLWKSLSEFHEAINWALWVNDHKGRIGKVMSIRSAADVHSSVKGAYYATIKFPETADSAAKDLEVFVKPEVLGHDMPTPFFGEVIVWFCDARSSEALFMTRS